MCFSCGHKKMFLIFLPNGMPSWIQNIFFRRLLIWKCAASDDELAISEISCRRFFSISLPSRLSMTRFFFIVAILGERVYCLANWQNRDCVMMFDVILFRLVSLWPMNIKERKFGWIEPWRGKVHCHFLIKFIQIKLHNFPIVTHFFLPVTSWMWNEDVYGLIICIYWSDHYWGFKSASSSSMHTWLSVVHQRLDYYWNETVVSLS